MSLTDREKRLLDVHSAIEAAAARLDIDWPKSMLEAPMTKMQRVVVQSRHHDIACLKMGEQIITDILLDVEGFGVLFALARTDLVAFRGIVELARAAAKKPEQVEVAA